MLPIKDDIPTRRFPVLTVAIIVICCAVYFLFEHGLWGLGATGNERVLEYGAIPYEITHPGKECAEAAGQLVCEGQPGVSGTAPDQAPWWLTIFTAMFMHGSLLHLGGNMLFLWIFGNNIEDSMSEIRFAAFYLLGGLVALGAQVLVDPSAAVPTVGASGAIAAVLGALRAALSTRAGDHRGVHHHLLHDHRAARTARARASGSSCSSGSARATSARRRSAAAEGSPTSRTSAASLFGLIAIRLFANRVQDDYEQAHRLPVY